MEQRTRTVFVSHAGVDRYKAHRVKELLEGEDIGVRLDDSELEPGRSFLSFMEDALQDADYCLLLWSPAAKESQWVRVEWEAALHKSIHDSPGFLIVGRLEELPVPELLRPRLYLDFFPELEPGVAGLVGVLVRDVAAEASTGKPLGKPRADLGEGDGAQIYVTSKLFGKTFPMRVALKTPVVAVVGTLVTALALPRTTPGAGGIQVRYEYGLAKDEESLREDETLAAHGVRENDVLWLETAIQLVSDTEPVRVQDGTAVYRNSNRAKSGRAESSLLLRARDEIRASVRRVRLE